MFTTAACDENVTWLRQVQRLGDVQRSILQRFERKLPHPFVQFILSPATVKYLLKTDMIMMIMLRFSHTGPSITSYT